jgi:hypothetical protein
VVIGPLTCRDENLEIAKAWRETASQGPCPRLFLIADGWADDDACVQTNEVLAGQAAGLGPQTLLGTGESWMFEVEITRLG